MRHRIAGPRDRLLSALAIALSMVLLAIVTSTLEPSISTTAAPNPPKSVPTSGISLIALLYQLLSFFGISLTPPFGQFSAGSVLDLVFTILQIIYQHRLMIITIAVLLTVAGLLYQYRHHLAVPRVIRSSSEATETATKSSSTATASADWPPDAEPESVQEAWVAMIQRVDDIENPSARTPAEWQQVAVDAGLPADTVETITTTFCAIQYGNATETDTRRKRVRTALDKFDDRQGDTDG